MTSTSYRAKPEDGFVWITGASSGIGRALALRLTKAGYRIAATARREAALRDLADESQGSIVAYPGDVTDAGAMRKIVADIEREAPIALAVLNAGAYHLSERDRFDGDLVWRTIEANLGGCVRCLDPLLAAMLPRRRGQIAIVASLAGYGGIPGSVAYGSAKAAMITMAEALRLTHERDGLTFQVVNPGFVDTAMTEANDYAMPFMVDANRAAAIIASGLAGTKFEITFPRRLVWPMKAIAALPYPIWLTIMDRATRRARRPRQEG